MERFIDRTYDHIPAQTDFVTRQWLDIPYMEGPRHTLDIYLPNEVHDAYPTIIDIYGGGLILGEKSSHKLEPALRLLEKGYAVVSINYSLISQAPFPTQILEVKAAIRWVKAHASEFNFDAARIALMGESSGAHLALLAGVTADQAMNEPLFGQSPTQSPTVQAIIALYGPYVFDQFNAQFAENKVTPKYDETGAADSFEAQMFGGVAPVDVPEQVRLANPATYFSTEMPPILAFAGTADPVVPVQQTENMISAARQLVADDHAELHIVSGGVHGPNDYMTPAMTNLKLAFLEKWL
ncbi:alpha/beta hydrolase fold domain-containing protein [Weissella soli]|uniref:alpha/beta hydrolase fold domain-containing protein n=1 Tax=Weissella soli TaxID=155866 RepID=UPI0035A0140E